MHRAILLVGSNILPEENIPTCIALLQEHCRVVSISTIWETQAVGSAGPNFLNAALLVETGMAREDFKWQVLRPGEEQMGRVRSTDKNAPRTIDIDIILWDGQVVDANLWKYDYVALPVSALAPDIVEPGTGRTLAAVARDLGELSAA
ncbi:2-amino-4-hydroxy-6-hydroxymethyldihydropteridine diphosphokinase, partial [bacterium]